MESWFCNQDSLWTWIFQFALRLRSPWLSVALLSFNLTGFSNTETSMLLHRSDLVGSWAIFSAMTMSSDKTEPKTVYVLCHSSWLARLMKNSGPDPTHATDPLLIDRHASIGTFLNGTPSASSVPWIRAYGGPNEAWSEQKSRNDSAFNFTVDIFHTVICHQIEWHCTQIRSKDWNIYSDIMQKVLWDHNC